MRILGRDLPSLLDRRATYAFWIIAAGAFALLMFVGRHAFFFNDEWGWVDVMGFGSPVRWLEPHHEHWSTVPFLLYRIVVQTVGLRSYLPYLAVLLALHVATGGAVFTLVRRSSGSFVAICAGLVVLLLGTGSQDLLWAFQIGFVGSVAAGLWALVLLERPGRRYAGATAFLLLVAVASSGIGLAFLAAATIQLAASPHLRRRLGAVAPAVIAYGLWFLVFGRAGISGDGTLLTATTLVAIPRLIALGFARVVSALTGIGASAGTFLALAIGAACCWAFLARRLPARTLGALAGIVALYGLIALARNQIGDAAAGQSRYLYVGVTLLVVALAAWLGRRADVFASRPWLGSPSRETASQLAVAAVVVVVTLSSLRWNLAVLARGVTFFEQQGEATRAYVALLDRFGGPTAYAPPATSEFALPDPVRMRRLIASYGNPERDVLWRGAIAVPKPAAQDLAVWRLIGGRLAASRSDGPTQSATAPALRALSNAVAAYAGGCLLLDGRTEKVTIDVPANDMLLVRTDAGGAIEASVGWRADPDPRDGVELTNIAGSWLSLTVPFLDDGSPTRLTLVPDPVVRHMDICLQPAGP